MQKSLFSQPSRFKSVREKMHAEIKYIIFCLGGITSTFARDSG